MSLGGGKAAASIRADDMLPVALGDLSSTSTAAKTPMVGATSATDALSLLHPAVTMTSSLTAAAAGATPGASVNASNAAESGAASARRARVAWGQGRLLVANNSTLIIILPCFVLVYCILR